MTGAERQTALAAARYDAAERAALRLVLDELRRRGHFDHLGIRYTAGKGAERGRQP